jgi:ATP-dependent DNA helicase RecG
MGQPADYVRQAGFDAIQQEKMVLQYAQSHGKITRKDAAALCRISEHQASRLLRKLFSLKTLRIESKGRSTHYTPP